MARLFKEIPRLLYNLKIIEYYNNFSQMGLKDEIDSLKIKVNNLYNLKDNVDELIMNYTSAKD